MTMQPRMQPSSTPWWGAARKPVQISESGRTISWNTSTSMTMTCRNLGTTSSQQHSWKEAWFRLVSNRLWQTPTISSNFYKYLWKSPRFSENTSWHLQDGVCRMLTYIFFCTTNIHIFSDNLLFSSDFFKFFKDHMPASCEWGLRMLYLLHSHWAGVGNFSYIFNKTRRR